MDETDKAYIEDTDSEPDDLECKEGKMNALNVTSVLDIIFC